jgi:hydroxyethylthiazole kinase-like uncharacterized protein yjeF
MTYKIKSSSILSTAIVSTTEMRALEAAAIRSGTSEETLMQRAGEGAAKYLLQILKKHQRKGRILVLCGVGNNGGDGLVMARALGSARVRVGVVCVGGEKYSESFLREFGKLRSHNKSKVSIKIFGEESALLGNDFAVIGVEELKNEIVDSVAIVDGLLGTGARAAPRGIVGELLNIVQTSVVAREHRPICFALDIPTGLSSDTGEIFSPHFRADHTATFHALKRGMTQFPGFEACGEVEIIDIGLDGDDCAKFSNNMYKLPVIPRRPADAHKGLFGPILIIGGAPDMPGAAQLAALAALRMGAGLTRVTRFANNGTESIPEVTYLDLHHDRTDQLEAEQLQAVQLEAAQLDNEHALKVAIENAKIVVLGPGLGTKYKKLFVYSLKLLCALRKLSVIDADGLNMLAEEKLHGRLCAELLHTNHPFVFTPFVFTPHPGEMGRLLNLSTAEIQRDRFAAVQQCSENFGGASVVLKGAHSLIYAEDRGWVHMQANPFLATPGSGDVLSGIIGALLGQGLNTGEAARMGVAIHAQAGAIASNAHSGPVIASDLIAALPEALASIRDTEW